MNLKIRIATISIITCTAQAAIAQDTRDALIAAPSARVMCKEMVATKADSADVLLTFMETSPFPRETIVAFRRDGHPLYMAVLLTEKKPDESVSHRLAVRFSGTGVYMRLRMEYESGIGPPRAVPLASENLTSVDVAKAQKLAQLLWARRCKTHNSE